MPEKPLPPRLQHPAGAMPQLLREVYADALKLAELEYRTAQAALAENSDDAARSRYARALADYDRLQAQFPFVAAGLGDIEV